MAIRHRDKEYFTLLDEHIDAVCAAAFSLEAALRERCGSGEFAATVSQIRSLEHCADETLHRFVNKLDHFLEPPIGERDDMKRIIHEMDNIIDAIKHATIKIAQCDRRFPESSFVHAHEFTALLCRTVTLLKDAIADLPKLCSGGKQQVVVKLRNDIIEINKLENVGDEMHEHFPALFIPPCDSEITPVMSLLFVLQKDIMDTLEHSLNQCEDVADVLDSILTKL